MRQGNFSELLVSKPLVFGKPRDLRSEHCAPARYGGRSGDGLPVPFPGNIIPRNRLSHNGMAIMSAYPAPTPGFQVGATNWIAQASHPINQRKGRSISTSSSTTTNKITARRRTDVSYFEYQPFDQGSGLTGKYFNRPNQTNDVVA